MGILDSIKKAFDMMPGLAASIGALVLTVIILALVAGVFVNETTSGSISVDNTSQTLIQQQTSNLSAIVGTLWDAVNSVAGFIVIGVIALIAIALLGKRFLKTGKGGGL